MSQIVSFNGSSSYSTTYGFQVQAFTVTPASRKVSVVELPGCDGSYSQGDKYSSNTLVIQLIFTGDTPTIVSDNIGKFLAVLSELGTMEIISSRQPNYKRYGYLSACSEVTVVKGLEGSTADVILTFSMDNPYAYNTTGSTLTSAASASHSISAVNNYRRTPMKITIACAANATVTSVSTTVKNFVFSIGGVESFAIYGSIAKGTSVIIDTDEYTVKLNDGTSLLGRWEGDMPELANGTNAITVTSAQGNVSVTIEYSERIL